MVCDADARTTQRPARVTMVALRRSAARRPCEGKGNAEGRM